VLANTNRTLPALIWVASAIIMGIHEHLPVEADVVKYRYNIFSKYEQ